MIVIRSKKAEKAKRVIAQKPKSLGWNTSNKNEIAAPLAGKTEPMEGASIGI